MINGGGQERGMRSGTLPSPLCVGLGAACAIAEKEMGAESERLRLLRDRFYEAITARLPEVYLNGDFEHRIPGNLNLSFAFVEGEGLMMGVKELAVSSGSACTSASLEPSYVLKAIGVDVDLAHTSLRIGFGRFTSQEDIDFAVDRIVGEVEHLREMSPLWEMDQEGIDLKSIEWADH
jgi:cysteine desulfurase